MTRYVFRLPWGATLVLVMDLSQASAPILVESWDDELEHTQFQTADAQHDEWLAFQLVAAHYETDLCDMPIAELVDQTELEQVS